MPPPDARQKAELRRGCSRKFRRTEDWKQALLDADFAACDEWWDAHKADLSSRLNGRWSRDDKNMIAALWLKQKGVREGA